MRSIASPRGLRSPSPTISTPTLSPPKACRWGAIRRLATRREARWPDWSSRARPCARGRRGPCSASTARISSTPTCTALTSLPSARSPRASADRSGNDRIDQQRHPAAVPDLSPYELAGPGRLLLVLPAARRQHDPQLLNPAGQRCRSAPRVHRCAGGLSNPLRLAGAAAINSSCRCHHAAIRSRIPSGGPGAPLRTARKPYAMRVCAWRPCWHFPCESCL
jgi:hypothetical protein